MNASPGPRPPDGLCLPCHFIRVVDGDTVEVQVVLRKKIRLIGIDCEAKTTNKGREAAHVAEALLEASFALRLFLPNDKADTVALAHSFERLPGHIYLDDQRTLSQLLLEKGLAIPWEKGQKGLG